MVVRVTRGGTQRIPRPAGVEPGGEPPWAGLPQDRRRFDLGDVRRALAAHPTPRPAPDMPTARPAAVLVALFERDGEARVVLTKRPETMPSHQGEIAFPGGKFDPALDATLADTALREAAEEVALGREHVEIVGRLDGIGTVASQFVITPFVGVLDAPVELVAHPREVVSVFDVALRELLDGEAFRRERWPLFGEPRDMDFYELPGETVWGATARILTNLLAWVVESSVGRG
jgi:8-oxo-dGTP pyrophosphatase MutT (NUDIX family)